MKICFSEVDKIEIIQEMVHTQVSVFVYACIHKWVNGCVSKVLIMFY